MTTLRSYLRERLALRLKILRLRPAAVTRDGRHRDLRLAPLLDGADGRPAELFALQAAAYG